MNDEPELPKLAALPARVYRVGKYVDAWTRRRPMFGSPSASRYDDPFGRYRTIYAASTRYDAYIAALAEFRPGPNSDIASKIALDDDDRARRIPSSQLDAVRNWITRRYLGEGVLDGRFVDLTNETSVAFLQRRFAQRLRRYELTKIDADSLTYAPREVTMEISRCFYNLEDQDNDPFDRVHGLAYRSRLSGGMLRWAIFAEFGDDLDAVIERTSTPISLDDPDLIRAIIDCDIDAVFPSTSNVWVGASQADE